VAIAGTAIGVPWSSCIFVSDNLTKSTSMSESGTDEAAALDKRRAHSKVLRTRGVHGNLPLSSYQSICGLRLR